MTSQVVGEPGKGDVPKPREEDITRRGVQHCQMLLRAEGGAEERELTLPLGPDLM